MLQSILPGIGRRKVYRWRMEQAYLVLKAVLYLSFAPLDVVERLLDVRCPVSELFDPPATHTSALAAHSTSASGSNNAAKQWQPMLQTAWGCLGGMSCRARGDSTWDAISARSSRACAPASATWTYRSLSWPPLSTHSLQISCGTPTLCCQRQMPSSFTAEQRPATRARPKQRGTQPQEQRHDAAARQRTCCCETLRKASASVGWRGQVLGRGRR